MPHIDAKSGEIVIRIVYDGAPEAGKTTNIQQLLGQISLQRRGAAKTPGKQGPRTEYFDWLDFSGGYLDGRRVRCQLISVPGQSALLHRRRYLLDTADAIVFVTDSRPAHFGESVENFQTTLRIVDKFARRVPVGVVLQANKQDLEGALPPAQISAALGMTALTPVVGSVASSGDGVMSTFVLAVRLATDRVRALLLDDPLSELPLSAETPDALYETMLALEPARERPSSTVPTAPAAEPEPQESVSARSYEAYLADPPPELIVEFRIEVAQSDPPDGAAYVRRNPLQSPSEVTVPNANEIASGHVWPPVKGRAALAVATDSRFFAPPLLRPWAPAGAGELVSEAGWVLHTADHWRFETEHAARLGLLTIVRRLTRHSETIPDGRALVVSREGESWRLWLLTPGLASYRELAFAAVSAGNVEPLARFVEGAAARLGRFREPDPDGPPVPLCAGSVGLEGERLVMLDLDEGDASPRPARINPLVELAELLESLVARNRELQAWFEAEGRRLLLQTPSTTDISPETAPVQLGTLRR